MQYKGPHMPSKAILLQELASVSPNINKIRRICRDNPGLIAATGLRLRIWALLLLGTDLKVVEEEVWLPNENMTCSEQQVLDADLKRTRAEIDGFRTSEWQLLLSSIMKNFCIDHGVDYKQGMNEVCAPFVYLHPHISTGSVPFTLFEAFLFRYLERFFCLDDSSFLFKAFRMFSILLMYHDPELAICLEENSYPPELYAPQWFLTMYSRTLALPLVLRLWDMMISVDDPAFSFFIGLSLLRRQREKILKTTSERIIEVLCTMQINGETDIDPLVIESWRMYKATPRCFTRNLRLCCVASPELGPSPFHMFRDARKARLSARSSNADSSSSSNASISFT